MIQVTLNPVGVESVRVICNSDLEEELNLIALRAIRPLVHQMDELLRRIVEGAFEDGNQGAKR